MLFPMTAGNSFAFGVDVKASYLISQRREAVGISSPHANHDSRIDLVVIVEAKRDSDENVCRHH